MVEQGTKERLLEAAVREFADNGFDNATVRDICSRAEANLNAVKYHFEDKEGLYVAAVSHAFALVKRQPPPETSASSEPKEQLRVFIHQMLEMALSDDNAASPHQLLLLREMAQPTKATEAIARAFIQPRFNQLDGIMCELLPSDISTNERHLFALSVVGQCMHYKFGRKFDRLIISAEEFRTFTADRLTKHIMGIVMAAIDARWQGPLSDGSDSAPAVQP